ncbi:Alpha/Beta hydrolase protein [Phascolomyces articulosus]|uniref:Alpha/Beta hydrolase protein n=1 Tax=Phascolomyces articulosus TaxID=60185 RepID=A0AAD5K6Y4_9FUNG|nr:Alpha/Beta hydrolase protein [Phascolomyces articulosus]
MSIEPFEIPSIPPERLALLNEKLKNAEYPNELETDVGWKYGAPRWAVEPLVQTWLNDYDWEKVRAKMNQWHHYHATIDGLRVHFIHEPSKNPDAIPLLLLNGWPSTFYEYHKVINPLRDGASNTQAFHVIVATMPGFGFSEAPKLPGYGASKIGDIFNQLMLLLDYNEYVVHGSDFGSMLGKWLALYRSENCKAYHTVYPACIPPIPTPTFLWAHPFKVAKFLASMVLGMDTVYGHGSSKIRGKSFIDVENDREMGYCAIQATRPYTLSFGLTDSPVGLLAWILEKYHNWTYPENKSDTIVLPETVTTEEFLTQVTIFWLTNSISSSTRFYYEVFNDEGMKDMFMGRVAIPTAVAYYAGELSKLPREWVEASSNLQQYKEIEVGGHFPSLECDEVFVDDIQQFGKLIKTKEYLK